MSEEDPPRIPYGELTPEQQAELRTALRAGKLEVNCPWWPRYHWELKSPHTTTGECAELWDEVYYRIRVEETPEDLVVSDTQD